MNKQTDKQDKPEYNSFFLTRRAFLITLIALAENSVCKVLLPTEGRSDEPTPFRKTESTPTKVIERGVIWKRELLISPYPFEPCRGFFTQEDKLFLTNPEGHAAALNLATGEQVWQHQDKGMVYGVDPEGVYVVQPGKQLYVYALDTKTGQPKWKTSFALDRRVKRPLWIGSETLHLPFDGISTREGPSFVTFDKRTGRVLWRSGEGSSEIRGMTDTTLLVVKKIDSDRHKFGLDTVTGKEKWKVAANIPVAPQISNDSFFYPLETDKGVVLIAANIDSGTVIWQSERTGFDSGLTISETVIYATYREGGALPSSKLIAVIERQTGKELWTWRSTGLWYFVGEFGETTILSDKSRNYTCAVETLTGKKLWQNNDLSLIHLVGVTENTLVGFTFLGGSISGSHSFQDDPSLLFGLDFKTGKQKWHLPLKQLAGDPLLFRDKIVYGSGSIYGGDRNLTILNYETGQSVSTIPLPYLPSHLVSEKDILLVQIGPHVDPMARLVIKEPPYEEPPCKRALWAVLLN